MLDLGSHHFDLWPFFLQSEITELIASVRSRYAAQDTAMAQLRCASGRPVTIMTDLKNQTSDQPAKQTTRPSVGDAIQAGSAHWSFGGDVAEHFEQHIERSVPNYRQGHEIVAALSDFFLYDGAVAYELGCSSGALTRRIAEWNGDKDVRIVGLELEAPMVNAAKTNCDGLSAVTIRQADILDFDFESADLIVSYYTMQFIRPALRQTLFDKIFATLKWGGGFILFEKVRAADARFQDIMSALYVDFKLQQGFDEREIIHKSRSLKGVLEPFSTQGNLDMLKRAGFIDCMTVFKHLCFEGFLAIK